MSERPRVPLPFGAGLDRATGIGMVEPSRMSDLRNVDLGDGKARVRKGLDAAAVFAGEDAILALIPLRQRGIGVAFTYRTGSREVRLWRVASTGLDAVEVGVVWTIPATASWPVVSATDAGGKVYIAHDEQDYAVRQVSRVYDPGAATITDFALDLDGSGVTAPTYFRGFTRHLAYLVGWGYGSEAVGEGDRPEVLRFSIPGRPFEFNASHYFLVGQQGEPIVTCKVAGGVLKVFKQYETHDFVGTNRTNFDVLPADPLFGCAGPRLAVEVAGTVFAWSAHGPRQTSGPGPTADLARPLALPDLAPDAAALATDPAAGFAFFDATEREVVFVFGRWGYVLHLQGEPRWSYRYFGVPLACAGIIYPSAVTSFGPTSHPEFTAIDAPGADDRTVGMTLAVVGAWNAGTTWERWRRATAGGGWALIDTGAAANPSFSPPDDLAPAFGTEYEYAVRFKFDGAYGTGYTSANPSDWPAVSRRTTTTGAASAANVPDITDLSVVRGGLFATFDFTAPPVTGWEVQLWESTDNVAWYDTTVRWVAGDVYGYSPSAGLKYWRVVATAPGYGPSGPSNVVSA